jgi:hypothetical protein
VKTIAKVINGLMILAKYEGVVIAAEHDEIFAVPDNPDDVSNEDIKELDALGWYFSATQDCWIHGV